MVIVISFSPFFAVYTCDIGHQEQSQTHCTVSCTLKKLNPSITSLMYFCNKVWLLHCTALHCITLHCTAAAAGYSSRAPSYDSTQAGKFRHKLPLKISKAVSDMIIEPQSSMMLFFRVHDFSERVASEFEANDD